MNPEEIIQFKKILVRKQRLAKKYQSEIKELLENCPHPQDEIIPKESYFSGSYDTKAYTHYWLECSLCRRRFDETIETHGWYG